MSNKFILGLADSRSQANRIVGHLLNAGFAQSAVSVLFPGSFNPECPGQERHTSALQKYSAGTGLKLLLGGAFALLTGSGVLPLPGFGSLTIAGAPLVEVLGRSAGDGVAGALREMGISEHEAGYYEKRVKEGQILLSVFVEHSGDSAAASKIFQALGAKDIIGLYEEAPGGSSGGATATAASPGEYE